MSVKEIEKSGVEPKFFRRIWRLLIPSGENLGSTPLFDKTSVRPGFFPNVSAATSRRVQRWARKRQGIDAPVTRLQSRRVYILPTGVGLVFALMAFAMLLGSMNYNNNLSFLLTFVLIGLGFVSMHQCQRNLVGLEVSFAGTDPVSSCCRSQRTGVDG